MRLWIYPPDVPVTFVEVMGLKCITAWAEILEVQQPVNHSTITPSVKNLEGLGMRLGHTKLCSGATCHSTVGKVRVKLLTCYFS